jgi:hypothetical protein
MERPEISPGAKLCFARLAQYAGADGDCRPGMTTLGRELGVSIAQARRYVGELEKAGLIVRKIGGGRFANRYAFLRHPWMESGPRSDVSGHPDQERAGTPLRCERAPLPDVSEEENYRRESKKSDDKKAVVVAVPLVVSRFPAADRPRIAALLEAKLKKYDAERVERNARYVLHRRPGKVLAYLGKAIENDYADGWTPPAPVKPAPPAPQIERKPDGHRLTPEDFRRGREKMREARERARAKRKTSSRSDHLESRT